MPSQEDFNEMIQFFFTLQLLTKLYHWNTTSFARHKATDGFGDELLDLVDKFVEVFVGRYKIKPMVNKVNLNPDYLTDTGIVSLFEQAKKYLESLSNKISGTDLLNIRDELLAQVNKTLYLFTLN
jgi:hypothetical protein